MGDSGRIAQFGDASFWMCHSKNNPPAMQGEESSLDERTPMLE